MKFVVKGEARIGGVMKVFERAVEAENEAAAKEKTYALFGSEHGTKRAWINIESVAKE